jgi:GNAT superfamily N-acetyltransferase
VSTLAEVPLTRATRSFACGTFAASYRRYSGLTSRLAFDGHVMAPFEAALLEDNGEGLRVLALAGSPDDFVGWSLVRGDTLVYVYVKLAYRGRDIGTSLLEHGLMSVVFQTPAGAALQRAKFGHALHPAPFALHALREAA